MTDERKFEDGLMTHSEKGDQIEWVEKYQFVDEHLKEIVGILGDRNDGKHWEYILDRVGFLEKVSKQYVKAEFKIDITDKYRYFEEMKRILNWISE